MVLDSKGSICGRIVGNSAVQLKKGFREDITSSYCENEHKYHIFH